MFYKPAPLRLELLREEAVVNLTLGEEKITWDASIFRKVAYDGQYDLFDQINRYWETLDAQTRQAIFDCYMGIREVFDNVASVDEQTRRIRPWILQLTALHDLEKLEQWVKIHGNIHIKNTFREEYIVDRAKVQELGYIQASTPEKTYLRPDVWKLVTFTIGCRIMFPIFGEYIVQTSDDIDTEYKEYRAGGLILGTTFEQYEGFQKLHTYIVANTQPERVKTSAILDGLPSDQFPYWALFLVLIRRLTIADVRGIGDVTIVSFIHNYIATRAGKYETNFSFGRTRDKELPSGSGDDESKLSTVEQYKIPEEHGPGFIVELDRDANNIQAMVRCLCPDVPKRLIDQALRAAQALQHESFSDSGPQIRIFQWLIGPYMAPRFVHNIEKLSVIPMLAVVQAMLWHNGWKDLAVFLSTTKMPDEAVMTITSGVTRSNIPRIQKDKITELYPHTRRSTGRATAAKAPPAGLVAVQKTANEILASNWKMHAHQDWIDQLGYQNVSSARRQEYRIPNDIRVQLADLCILIAESPRPFNKGEYTNDINALVQAAMIGEGFGPNGEKPGVAVPIDPYADTGLI